MMMYSLEMGGGENAMPEREEKRHWLRDLREGDTLGRGALKVETRARSLLREGTQILRAAGQKCAS